MNSASYHPQPSPFPEGEGISSQPLRAEEIARIGEQVRRRVLHGFARSSRLAAEDARDRLACDNGGFSLDAAVQRLPNPIGEAAQSPPIGSARGSPMWDEGLPHAVPDWDALAQLEHGFDQQVPWKRPAPPGGAQAPARPPLLTPTRSAAKRSSIVATKVHPPLHRLDAARTPLHRLDAARTPLLACSVGGSVSPNPPVVRLDFLSLDETWSFTVKGTGSAWRQWTWS